MDKILFFEKIDCSKTDFNQLINEKNANAFALWAFILRNEEMLIKYISSYYDFINWKQFVETYHQELSNFWKAVAIFILTHEKSFEVLNLFIEYKCIDVYNLLYELIDKKYDEIQFEKVLKKYKIKIDKKIISHLASTISHHVFTDIDNFNRQLNKMKVLLSSSQLKKIVE